MLSVVSWNCFQMPFFSPGCLFGYTAKADKIVQQFLLTKDETRVVCLQECWGFHAGVMAPLLRKLSTQHRIYEWYMQSGLFVQTSLLFCEYTILFCAALCGLVCKPLYCLHEHIELFCTFDPKYIIARQFKNNGFKTFVVPTNSVRLLDSGLMMACSKTKMIFLNSSRQAFSKSFLIYVTS